MVEPLRHRQTKGAENRHAQPTATAPHSDSTGAGGADRWYRRLIYNFQPYDGFAPLLTIDRQAFWPTLFTSRTLQPVHVRPPYKAISVEQAMGPPDTALTALTKRDLELDPYMADGGQASIMFCWEGRANCRPGRD